MSAPERERRRLAGGQGDGNDLAGSGDLDQSNPRWTPGRIAVARCRARLRHLAVADGRPLLTLTEEREHAAARRRGEVARLRLGGAG